jgi:serine/threonine-protein kinase PknK
VTLAAGDLLQGRYRVGAPLGQGGMGSVFEAREEPQGSRLVVKQLRLDVPELLESFRGEFALLSRVADPHLLRVVDFGSERLRGDVHHYYVADRVEGVTLAERARRAPGAQLLGAVCDAVTGLAALHEAGIRHGDFTPANVLVDRAGGGVLIDLGCARPFGVTQHLAGTEGYLAPELLEGKAGDARSDLFAVGRTLTSLFEADAPANVARLCERLTRAEPYLRPTDCAEVLEILGRKPRRRARAWGPSRLLGREAELQRFEQWLAAFLSADSGPRVLDLCAAPGMGSSRLLRELVWRCQLRAGVLRARPGEPVSRLLACALGLAEPVNGRRGAMAAAAVLAERSEPLLLVIEDAEQLESDEQELLLALSRSLGLRGNLALLVSSRAPLAGDGVLELRCERLPDSAVQAWAAPYLSDKRLRELVQSAAGSPKKVQQLLDDEGHAPRESAARDSAAERSSLSPAEESILALLQTQEGSLPATAFGLSWDELHPLLERGLLERDGEHVALGAAARRALAAGAVHGAQLARAHLRAADWLERTETAGSGLSQARVIFHLALAGELGRAEHAFLAQLGALRSGPRRVVRLLAPLRAGTQRADVLLELASLFLELGEPRLSLAVAVRAARKTKLAALEQRAALVVADALSRLGKPARAERLLAGRAARVGAQPGAFEILQRLARARLSRGDYLGSRHAAEQALELAPDPAQAGACHETLGVACAYSGDRERAQAELDLALSLLGSEPRPRALADSEPPRDVGVSCR